MSFVRGSARRAPGRRDIHALHVPGYRSTAAVRARLRRCGRSRGRLCAWRSRIWAPIQRARQFQFSLPPRRSHRSGIAAWASGRSAPQLLGRSSACWTKCKGGREWPRRSASLLWSEAVPACRFSSKAAPAPPPPPDSSPNSLGSDARYFAITPGYFGTMRIPNSVGRRRRPRIEADRAPGGDCDLDRSRSSFALTRSSNPRSSE